LGKSTLVNTLFASHLIDSKGRHTVEDADRQTTEIESVSHGKYLIIIEILYFFSNNEWFVIL
jgi:predicted GTPase